jgi:hypothetical protein
MLLFNSALLIVRFQKPPLITAVFSSCLRLLAYNNFLTRVETSLSLDLFPNRAAPLGPLADLS